MGLFRKERKPPAPDDRYAPDRLDLQLLRSSAVTLYYKSGVLAQDLAWLQQAGYRVYTFDAVNWRTPADFHADVKRELAAEHYVGNLASWLDCLGDLEVPREGGVVMQLRHFDAFARADPKFAHTLLDSIESASRRFLLMERRLLALVQSDDPRIRFERIGAAPVNWNPREWLDADRGLRPAS
jgi:RNAse (barnase) inhibitor barstar